MLGQELEEEWDGTDQPRCLLCGLGQRAGTCAGSSPAAQPPPGAFLKFLPNLSVAAMAVPAPTGTGVRAWIRQGVICPSKCICCLIAARGAGSTKQCQGSAGSQRRNPATRSRRMSIQSQLASPRRSRWIQLTTFPPRNSHPGAVATREGHPPAPSATNPASRGSVREQSPRGRGRCPVPSPAHTLRCRRARSMCGSSTRK